MSNRRTRILFPIFAEFEVRVIVAKDMARTARALREPEVANAEAAFVSKDDQPGYGWLVVQPDADAGLIAHEVHHAIKALERFLGTEFDEETFAHHQGYLVKRVFKFLAKG